LCVVVELDESGDNISCLNIVLSLTNFLLECARNSRLEATEKIDDDDDRKKTNNSQSNEH